MALEAFKIKPSSNSIRQDIVRFEELRRAAEYSIMGLFTSIQNNSYLDQMFEEDTRPGVVASLTASNQANLPYVDRIDALHRLQNCDTIPHGKEISMKSISSKPKQKTLCRNFAKGNCLYEDMCFNLHEKASHPERQQTPRQDRPPYAPQQRTEPPAPTYCSAT